MPNEIGGIAWFGVDDTYTTCYFPIYCCVTEISNPFATGDINRYSTESAWWAFNFAANYANTRYSDIVVDIKDVQKELENIMISQQPAIEKMALGFNEGERIEFLTNYSVKMGEMVHDRWVELGNRLVTKYNDGYIKDDHNHIQTKGYPEEWLEMISR